MNNEATMTDDLHKDDFDNDDPLKESGTESSSTNENANFIDRIIEMITGFTADERVKMRKLRDISRQLKRSKIRYYNYKKDLILPALSAKLYEIFRLTQNLQRFMDVNKRSNSIKLFLFELFSTAEQKRIKSELEEDKLDRLIKSSKNTNAAIEKIKKMLSRYTSLFTPDAVRNINATYNMIVDFANIVNFDWIYLLHKFDADIAESNFNYKPDYEFIEGKYVVEEMLTLNDYLETIDFNKDSKVLVDYIVKISGDDGMEKILKKIVQGCRYLKKNDSFTKIMKLIQQDPYFKPKTFPSKETIVQDYILTFQQEIKRVVDHALKDLKKRKIERLLLEIFHTTVILRLKQYTDKLNELLEKKGIAGFRYTEPLNYLKAFVLDFCKGQIKARIDYLIIKGTWCTHSVSAEYSMLLEYFNSITEKIVSFDNSLAEDEKNGKSLRKLIFAANHDSNAKAMIKKLILQVDSEAIAIINSSIKVFIQTANKLKVLTEDYNSKAPKIIINFHKINWDFPDDFPTEMTNLYKKIADFIALLKYFIKENKPK